MCIRDSNHSGSKRVNFQVSREEEKVALTFTRSISKTTINAGDSVKVTYNPVSYTHLDVYKRQAGYQRDIR